MLQQEFTLRWITPAYLGGAGQLEAELRGAPFRGALRYWWRVLHPGHQPERLFEQESEIWGSAGSGKSKVMISIQGDCRQITVGASQDSPLSYLGYGAVKSRAGIRQCFAPDQEFKLRIQSFSKDAFAEAIGALTLTHRMGCLGAKSHNGFGSFVVNEIERLDPGILALPIRANDDLSLYPARSNLSRLLKSAVGSPDAKNAFLKLGDNYRQARKKIALGDRELIGAPVTQIKGPKLYPKGSDRHGKAIYLKVVPQGDLFYGQCLFLPYLYALPERRQRYLDVHQTLLAEMIQIGMSEVPS